MASVLSLEFCNLKNHESQIKNALGFGELEVVQIRGQFRAKGRTFQELDKQTMSSANFQAENFLSGLVFDSSTFLLSLKIDQNSRFVYRTLEKCGL